MNRRLAVALLALCAFGASAARSAAPATILPGFRSPSGNIGCLLVPGHPATLLCHIARADYAQALQARCMAGPSVDWHGFELTATGRGSTVCSGGILYDPDTQRPSYVTLPYGKSWRHAPFTCRSETTGVTCKSDAGHGLFISRASWRAW